jgi:5-aminolevulinate synthase
VEFEENLSRKLDDLRRDSTYRVFTNIRRIPGTLSALCYGPDGSTEIAVWCSNDYQGMNSHPQVIDAMMRAAREYEAGAGGTLNISGNNHALVELETEKSGSSAMPDRHGARALARACRPKGPLSGKSGN